MKLKWRLMNTKENCKLVSTGKKEESDLDNFGWNRTKWRKGCIGRILLCAKGKPLNEYREERRIP